MQGWYPKGLSNLSIQSELPRNSGRAVTKMMDSQSVHPKVPGGVSFVGAGRRASPIQAERYMNVVYTPNNRKLRPSKQVLRADAPLLGG